MLDPETLAKYIHVAKYACVGLVAVLFMLFLWISAGYSKNNIRRR